MLALTALGALLAPLNSTMLAVALPEIRGDFGLASSTVGWLISSYLIAMAVVQPISGRIGDELGRLRVFRGALVAFLVFSLAAVVAPTFAILVAFRTLQAVAGAVLIPNGIGMLRAAVPPERFGTYIGINSSIIGATAAFGPLAGAAILAVGPWRMLFLVNVPFVLAALALASRAPVDNHRPTRPGRIEPMGLILFALLLVAVTVAFNVIGHGTAGIQLGVAALIASVAAVFIAQQRLTRTSVAAWQLFRVRGFIGASTHILLMNLVMYTTLLAIPFFITDVQGRSAGIAGLLLGAMAGLQALSAPLAGRVSDSVGRRAPALFSSGVALGAALLLLVGVNEDTSFGYLVFAVTALGLGVGIGFVTASAAATESVPLSLSGSAAGTQSMMRYVGSIVGTGILGGLLAGSDGNPDPDAFRLLFSVVAVIAALSVLPAALISSKRRAPDAPPRATAETGG